MGRRIFPAFERQVVIAIASYLERHRQRLGQQVEQRLLAELDTEQLRSVVDDVWESLAGLRLSEVFRFVGEQDIEDFVVLVHEFWLRYRKTAFFREISRELVDYLRARSADALEEVARATREAEGVVESSRGPALDPAGGERVVIRDPHGRRFEVVHGDRRRSTDRTPPPDQPQRLAHAVLNSHDVPTAQAFLERALGFTSGTRFIQLRR